jgi:hypothetical protein
MTAKHPPGPPMTIGNMRERNPNATRIACGERVIERYWTSLKPRDEADPFGPALPFIFLLAHVRELSL